ncbi:MAG: 50S ribosomal protein L20 [Planctomycetota bacterium]|jgi:large subunit ribosomal protein L20
MRVTRGLTKHRRRKRYFKEAKGFRGSRRTLWRNVIEATLQARKWSYIHRKQRRRELRKLWIMRINAAARQHGLTYASFMHKAAQANLGLDRKALADIAASDPAAFQAIVESVNG